MAVVDHVDLVVDHVDHLWDVVVLVDPEAIPTNKKGEGCFGGMVYSKVVSTHLWNTPRKNLYQRAIKGFLS